MSTGPIPNVDCLEPTWKRATTIWWAIAWRGFVLWLAVAVVVSTILEATGMSVENPSHNTRILTGILVIVPGIPTGIYVVKLILRKRFREFRICVVRSERKQALGS